MWSSRKRLVGLIAVVAAAGCAFDPSGVAEGGDDDGAGVDAALGPPVADAAAADGSTPIDTTPDAAPGCPSGYLEGPAGASAYRVSEGGRSWLAAEEDCEDDGPGAHLVVIDSEVEHEFVASMLPPGAQVWIGLSDRVDEGQWYTVTYFGAQYLPWDGGEPNDFFGEDCVEMVGERYNDESCGDVQAFVCECDGLAGDPAAYDP